MLVRYPSYTYELQDDATGDCLARAIVVEYNNDEYFIDSVAVRRELQGSGYGTQMMNILIREYRDVTLVLKVDAYGSQRLDNQALEDWYKRLGFVWDELYEYMKRYPDSSLSTSSSSSLSSSE